MNRRGFLKTGALLSMAFFLPSSPIKGFFNKSIEHSTGGKTYRGTADGEVYVSADAGRSWQLHYRLGPEYSILNIFSGRNGNVYLTVGYKTYSFHLNLSQDGKYWKSESLAYPAT
jgi:hypothetical protein